MNLSKGYFGFFSFTILQIITESKQQVPSPNLIFEISETINELNAQNNEPEISHKTKIRISFHKKQDLNLQQDIVKSNLRNLGEKSVINDPIIERICKKTGCSCGGPSLVCDAQDVFEVANDVVNVIDNINRQVDNDNDTYNNGDLLRCGTNKCKEKSYDKVFNENDRSFTDDFIVDSTEENTSDKTLLEVVLSELSGTNKNSGEKNEVANLGPLTPEDIYNYYRGAMDDVRDTLMGFIKYRTGFKTVRSLPKDIRTGIQAIRDRYRHFKMSDKSLKKQIFKLLLDDTLKIRIVPNTDPQASYDIFLPHWMYIEILKKKQGRRLRTINRVLPLTSQQKTRIQNKQGAKKISKFVWRRNLDSNLKQYGVPFVLDIQGLGQLN